MRVIKILPIGLLLLSLLSCENLWDEHYSNAPATVDMNVWDAIQEEADLSMYVEYMRSYEYDTLFLKDDPYSLFIPNNAAFSALTDTAEVSGDILNYHISRHYIQSRNIDGREKIQTLAEKFAFFGNVKGQLSFDDIDIEEESPLYTNGKFFVTNSVGQPKPNLYEFFAMENPVLTAYIDSQDSIIIDKELSRPIGFDEFGNTVYDTVAEIYNEFEDLYFEVSEEHRVKTATIVFPREEDYNNALDLMAQSLGDVYQDHTDIPLDWQYDILIPYLLDHGVFENMLEAEEFIPPPPPDTLKLKNILGDSIYIDYTVSDQAFCSNGYAYNYTSFLIPDTLYSTAQRLEGEHLLEPVSATKYAWAEGVDVKNTISFSPIREYSLGSSNDSIMRVPFNLGYDQEFEVDFPVETLFPQRYLMVVRTHMFVGGIYDIYVNDELVMEDMDWYDYVRQREVWRSVTGARYKPEGAFNRFDCWVDNAAAYGQCRVKFVYKAPGNVNANGLVIDYIDFIPYEE